MVIMNCASRLNADKNSVDGEKLALPWVGDWAGECDSDTSCHDFVLQ